MGYISNNLGKGALIVVNQGGAEQNVAVQAFVNKGQAFTGVLDLSTPFGTFWNDYVQTGALAITVGGYSQVGGCDALKITANGSAITFPGNFVNIGTAVISTVASDINRI
jgi:hypothetical protein